MPGITFYVSGHGFGHAVRSAQVIKAIQEATPELPIRIRATAPSWLFPTSSIVEPAQLDLGVLQRGSVHVRPRETLREFARLLECEDERLDHEVKLARERGVTCVVADIPSAAFEIAHRLGVPGIGIANFCWHWIYEPYAEHHPELAHVVEHIQRQERLATTLLRLPFAWEFDCFRSIHDVPLIGRLATQDRSEVRRRLGIAQDQRVALLSFGSFGLTQPSNEALARWNDWLFLTTETTQPDERDGNVQNVTDPRLSYVDLLASADAVVTKPGFGIVSDALVNRVPVLYCDRGNFREYGVLSRALRTLGRAKFIPRATLLAGMLGPYLDDLMSIRKPWASIEPNGATVIAKLLIEAALR